MNLVLAAVRAIVILKSCLDLPPFFNQSDNSDEADSGEHIDSYSESAEVLGNADNSETASTDELNLNETTLTATSVSVCDDVDDPNTSHDFCVHVSTDEELATPQEVSSSVSPNVSVERTSTSPLLLFLKPVLKVVKQSHCRSRSKATTCF